VGCINTISLQIGRIRSTTEFVHPTSGPTGALDLQPPDANARISPVGAGSLTDDLQVRRRDLLGGLIHEYELAAAA